MIAISEMAAVANQALPKWLAGAGIAKSGVARLADENRAFDARQLGNSEGTLRYRLADMRATAANEGRA